MTRVRHGGGCSIVPGQREWGCAGTAVRSTLLEVKSCTSHCQGDTFRIERCEVSVIVVDGLSNGVTL